VKTFLVAVLSTLCISIAPAGAAPSAGEIAAGEHAAAPVLSGLRVPGERQTSLRDLRRTTRDGNRPAPAEAAARSRTDRKASGVQGSSRIIEEYGQRWSGSAWIDSIRWLYSYDKMGNFTEEVRQTWSGSAWVNQLRWTMEYDGEGRDTTEVRQYWSGGAWVNDYKWLYSYDLAGYWTGEIILSWGGGSWENYKRWTYTYNGNGDLTEELEEWWNVSLYQNLHRYVSTYTGTFQDRYARDLWVSSAWDPEWRIDYTHDGAGNFLTETRQSWTGSVWQNSWRYTNTYDGNNNDISWLFEYWTGSWVLSDLDSLSYDVNNNRTGHLHQYFDAGWQYYWRGIFSYYGNNDWMEDIWQVWTGSVWINDERFYPVWEAAGTTQKYAVQNKWNLVSVPLTLGDYAKSSVFPTAVSSAFGYASAYTEVPVLMNGPGYWLKFDGGQNISMTGIFRSSDTVAVAKGWNIIGSLSGPVAVSSISSDPPGLVASGVFAYTNAYAEVTTIEPGRGYWVKMSEPGNLIMNTAGAGPAASRIRIVPDGEAPPPPPGGPEPASLPAGYDLVQNYPNPFNPATEIRYTLPAAGPVRLSVFNLLGQEVARLVDGHQDAGELSVSFDASGLPSGVYAYRLSSGTYQRTLRMILLR